MNKIYPAVVVFYDETGKVLMHNRKGEISKFGEKWAFLGGAMEEGESPQMAAKREIWEEVNYKIDDTRDRFMFFKKYKTMFKEDTEAEISVFEAKFPGLDSFSNSDEVMLQDLHLFTISEALQLEGVMPIAQEILKDLKNSVFTPQEAFNK